MQSHFHVRNIGYSNSQMTSAVYLQVSIVSQALIFVTRSRSWSFLERPGLLLMSAFMIAQLVGNSGYFWLSAFLSILGFLLGFGGDFILLFPHTDWPGFVQMRCRLDWDIWWVPMGIGLQIATFIAVYATWGFANIRGIGWGWAGVIWLYSLVFYIPLDIIKFATRYILSGRAWDNMLNSKVLLHFLKESERNCRLCMCLYSLAFMEFHSRHVCVETATNYV